MTRQRLQGHNEDESWAALTRLYPNAVISIEWTHVPVDHWTATVVAPALGNVPVSAADYTRYGALNRIIVALEKEGRIQDEMMQRAAS